MPPKPAVKPCYRTWPFYADKPPLVPAIYSQDIGINDRQEAAEAAIYSQEHCYHNPPGTPELLFTSGLSFTCWRYRLSATFGQDWLLSAAFKIYYRAADEWHCIIEHENFRLCYPLKNCCLANKIISCEGLLSFDYTQL